MKTGLPKKKAFTGPRQYEIVPFMSKIKANLYGIHAVRAAWNNPARDIRALYVTDQALKAFPLAGPGKRPPPTVIDKKDLDRALPGAVHQGIAVDAAPLEEVAVRDLVIRAEAPGRAVIVMLDQVTDPHNMGAIIRSACAFGAAGMIVQRKHAPDLDNGALAKAACGGVEHLPVAYETNLSRTLEILKEHGFWAAGLDERGEKTIAGAGLPEKTVLVLGAEGAGLRPLVRDHCDFLVRLPTKGPIASLNVSNAAAVALYALLG